MQRRKKEQASEESSTRTADDATNFSFTIYLQPPAHDKPVEDRVFKDEKFLRMIEQEFATKYCEFVGIQATEENKRTALEQVPLKGSAEDSSVRITASWKARGWVEDFLKISSVQECTMRNEEKERRDAVR